MILTRSSYSRTNIMLLAALCLLTSLLSESAEETTVLATGWQSIVTSNTLAVTVLALTNSPASSARPTIIYLKNLASPRVGTETDDSILRDFQHDGYLVVTIDFNKHPCARVPFINRDLNKLRNDLYKKNFLTDHRLDDAHIFIVPEGCRLKRDIAFYRDPKRTLAMDIIFPSKPTNSVGAIIEFSCDNQNRFGNGSLSICSDTILDAEATEGFAVAMADHPVAAPYKGIDLMPDCARKIKAAVRTLRAEGASLRLNDRIAPVGFSRGSGMALMLVTTDRLKEFENFGEHTDVSSSVEGAVVMSGRFTYLDLLPNDNMLARYATAWGKRDSSLESWRRQGALDYLTKPVLPVFLTINCTEGPDALHQMKVLRDRLEQLHSPFTFHLDNEPRGHKVPLDPEILGAMNEYLKQQVN